MKAKAIWLRVVPVVIIALTAAGFCVQTACSGGGGNIGSGSGYGYGYN